MTKFYLYAKDLSKPKYEYLIKNRENAGIKHVNDGNAFIECSNTMDDVYKSIDDYNPNRRRKIIVFDDMIADIMTNKKFQAIIKELFIRCRKINISLVFITQSYFSVPKDVRLNSTHYFVMKINNKRELQTIAISHSADIDHKDFMKIYREYTKESYTFLTIDTTLPSRNPLRFRKNLFDAFKNMPVTDQIKILDRRIKQNEAQHDLDMKAAKISAFSSNNLDKYEHLTDEDLGLKPSTVEPAKFEYSPLGKILNKSLSEDDEKEGILKRLENIKNKIDQLLNRFNTTNKIPKNKTNSQSKKLIYNVEYSFAKLRNIDDIKKYRQYFITRFYV